MTNMREDFERWWEKHGTQSTVHKEDFWEAWQAALRSIEPDGLGCETW